MTQTHSVSYTLLDLAIGLSIEILSNDYHEFSLPMVRLSPFTSPEQRHRVTSLLRRLIALPDNRGYIVTIDGRLPQYGAEERTEQQNRGHRERR